MNGGGSPLLSVRAEARQLVAPDYAVVDGLVEHTARSKVEAVRSVTGSLDRLTADLVALGAVPFDEGAGRLSLMARIPIGSGWRRRSCRGGDRARHARRPAGRRARPAARPRSRRT
jgi:hypothetical protein